ncbi:hypothetical protein [Desulfosporosinus nitroreducens]|uniref:Spore germination GerD central core domain-containing protein n=1 Tax=Desulfosporosinus nitroreducens TaxID=2018668 RepID=A0ABT8QRB6_9FIRM|nr:hypothetical protein [Desulfosporosinus nitroreducens]MDO0823850.1 hypothetical protein [Desulfosporosinus nitroreducens]
MIVVNKKIKSIVFIGLTSIAILSLAGCGSQTKDIMSTSNMTQYMTSNTTAMVDVLSSPDTRQSVVKVMGSSQMMPVMVDMMKNSDIQKNMISILGSGENKDTMVSIMANPSMFKPMVEAMSDPKMKATFKAMLKDPALQPLVNEALGVK